MSSISTLVDRVKIVVLSSGTGPFSLGSAVPSYRGVEALIDGATYSYATESGSNFEFGTGVYLSATNSLVRTPTGSSNSGAAVAFPANIEISFTVLAQDIAPPGALPIVQTTGSATDKAMSQNAVTTQLDAINTTLASKVDIAGARAALSAVNGIDYDDTTGVFSLASLATLLGILNGSSVQASEAISAGDFVNVYNSGGLTRVRQAIASDPTKFANGYALAAIVSGSSGLVIFGGVNLATTVSAPASEVWLSDATPGAWTTTPPSASGSIVQALGAAIPSVGVFFNLRERVLL